MPNIVPKTMEDWMRRRELSSQTVDERKSDLVAGSIADTVDLDDFLWSGRYYRESTTGTTTALGYPEDGAAGTLEVIRNPASVEAQQVFHNRVTGVSWIRWYDGVSWGPWMSGGFGPGVYDTGWVDRSGDLNSGFSAGGALESRRIGATVWWRGRIDVDTNWGAAFSAHTVITDMGSEWSPGFPDVQLNASGAITNTFFRVVANSTGVLQVRCSTANHTGSAYMTSSYVSGDF